MDFTYRLLEWYRANARDLPWRNDPDPYHIWISEIILQQTRVSQGIHYYQRFTDTFPDVRMLADASEDQVLKLWQGLGYYSRARNLHQTAKDIVNQYDGTFPKQPEELRKLKGMGPYTAAAVSSFAYGTPIAALDGNGYRILSRYFALDVPPHTQAGKKLFEQRASSLVPQEHSADFNQALMDLGSLICTRTPLCTECPLKEGCAALARGLTELLPIAKEKTASRLRYLNYLDIRNHGNLFFRQRQEKDIWKGLYELPLIETPGPTTFEQLINTDTYLEIAGDALFTLRGTYPMKAHKLSHQTLMATFYLIDAPYVTPYMESHFIKTDKTSIEDYAISRLTDKYFNIFI